MKKTGTCVDCGAQIKNTSKRCRSCANKGINNPSYKSGKYVESISVNPVPVNPVPTKDIEFSLETEKFKKVISELKRENTYLKKQRVTDEDIREHILDIKKDVDVIPEWTTDIESVIGSGNIGVPTIQLSDWHFGETVFPEQVFGKNEFNLEIGINRAEKLCTNFIDVLDNHLSNDGGYPGIVILLNGDFVSGDIHEELTATNDKPIMPAVLAAYKSIAQFIDRVENQYGNVMVFCAAGNHARTTKKIPFKNFNYTNYDWLIYQLLDQHFVDHDNVRFSIATGADIQYQVYNHKYRMTHGNQFRGGQGFIGPFAPITRGELKKRASAETYGENYDTLVIGHFHQLMVLSRVMVNGSLIGFNEMALNCNFPYEPPRQGLWITHPKRGITINMPIYCDDGLVESSDKSWVSWEK